MIDLTTYALLRKQITTAVSGISDVRAEGDELVFVLADGNEVRVAIPATEIRDAVVRDDVLVLTLENDKEVVVDATLTQSGQAADAKVTGEAVSQLKGDMAGKLPKSPTDWAAWTAEEQAAARNRIGISGEYELIESITLGEPSDSVVRAIETDGTPYNFKKILVLVDSVAAESEANVTVIFRKANTVNASDDIATVSFAGGIATVKKSYSASIDISNQIATLFVRSISNGGNTNPNTLSVGFSELSESCTVKKLYVRGTSPMAAGTSIRIYGVRA